MDNLTKPSKVPSHIAIRRKKWDTNSENHFSIETDFENTSVKPVRDVCLDVMVEKEHIS